MIVSFPTLRLESAMTSHVECSFFHSLFWIKQRVPCTFLCKQFSLYLILMPLDVINLLGLNDLLGLEVPKTGYSVDRPTFLVLSKLQ